MAVPPEQQQWSERVHLSGLLGLAVDGRDASAARQIAADVAEGKCSLLDLVDNMGVYLTHTETEIRALGTRLLSDVLQHNLRKLQPKELEVLALFYVDKLQDHYTVLPGVLQGFVALSSAPNLPVGLEVRVLKAIFQDVHVQSLVYSDRRSVYNIIANFMETKEPELKALGTDFTYGFVQATDGEKDPRNLLISFRIAHGIVSRGYQLGSFVEELFEVTSCYFPIDFTPPTTDPHGITAEQLVLGLRAVLSSTPKFAEFCLPLLLEKLDSDINSAKVDALETLISCCEVYTSVELAPSLPSLWASIRREVCQVGGSGKVEGAALRALRAVLVSLSRSVVPADGDDPLTPFLCQIHEDCRPPLLGADMALVWPSAKLLQACCGASYRACSVTVSAILPLLLQQYEEHQQLAKRHTVLGILRGFLTKCLDVASTEEVDSPVAPLVERLCELLYGAVTDAGVQLRCAGLATLTVLARLPACLAQADINCVVGHITRLLVEDSDEQVNGAAMQATSALAPLHTDAFLGLAVPRLLEILHSDDERSRKALQCTERLCCHPRLTSALVPHLLSFLGSTGTEEAALAACATLLSVAEARSGVEDCRRLLYTTAVPHLLRLAVCATLPPRRAAEFLRSEEVVASIAKVLSTLSSRAAESSWADGIVSQIVSLFLDGDLSLLQEDGAAAASFQPLHAESPTPQTQLTVLLSACLSFLPRTVAVPSQDRLLRVLVHLCCCSLHEPTYSASASCLAALLNKHPTGEELDSLLDDFLDRVHRGLLPSEPAAERRRALVSLLWLTKALVIRYHPTATFLVNQLVQLLSDPELGPAAADGFALLTNDTDGELSPAAHADVRPLFRQRVYTEHGHVLLLQLASALPDHKAHCLRALSHLLGSLPKQVVLSEMPTLCPVLLDSLSSADATVQRSALSLLREALCDAPLTLSAHVDTLVTRLLLLCGSAAMRVRMGALQCICALVQLPAHVVLPHKQAVIHALGTALDDHKRLVRKEAVEARTAWYMLGC
ncbi:MMS19 nucleotide excision repair protein homolog [Lethenteron reissneri]|uniref:MMS19 nucleotide excision repair protein homolog n=1 Tax=Lethenteron reissneri TaxID=7753 RepID=UPI002AB673ED|nr:MMS19 nucleotide excision repair protein homolog [Lethenteron reissneri]